MKVIGVECDGIKHMLIEPIEVWQIGGRLADEENGTIARLNDHGDWIIDKLLVGNKPCFAVVDPELEETK